MNTEHKSNTSADIKDLWQTPKFVFDYYDRRFNFGLDMAASETNKLCDKFMDESRNALDCDSFMNYVAANGIEDRAVWLNPPFSKIQPWIDEVIFHRFEHTGMTFVVLLPADSSVKWFKTAFDNCTECHFISGRLSFVNAETQKPVNGNNKGSVVFIFDPKSPVKKSVHLIDRDDIK